MSHSEYAANQTREMVKAARAVLTGDLGAVIGVRKILAHRSQAQIHDSHLFDYLEGFYSGTDSVPTGEARQLFATVFVARMDAEALDYTNVERKQLDLACRAIVDRYGDV